MLFERSLLALLLTKGHLLNNSYLATCLNVFHTVDLHTKWSKTQGLSIVINKDNVNLFSSQCSLLISLQKQRFSEGFSDVFRGSKGSIGKKRFKVETFFRREGITLNPLSKSNHLRCSAGEGVLKSFTKFAGKHLCLWTLAQLFSCEFCEIFKNTFF